LKELLAKLTEAQLDHLACVVTGESRKPCPVASLLTMPEIPEDWRQELAKSDLPDDQPVIFVVQMH
jgi:hypothetical protein